MESNHLRVGLQPTVLPFELPLLRHLLGVPHPAPELNNSPASLTFITAGRVEYRDNRPGTLPAAATARNEPPNRRLDDGAGATDSNLGPAAYKAAALDQLSYTGNGRPAGT